MKAVNTVTLMATMTLLNLADSETPITSRMRKRGADQEGGQVEQVDDRRAVHEHVDAVLLQMMAGRARSAPAVCAMPKSPSKLTT